jgi:phospholipase C
VRHEVDEPRFDRRRFLSGGLALGGGVAFGGGQSTMGRVVADTVRKARSIDPAGSDLGAIKHVVFLMQENRSFDHYFGSYKGVRGFDDHASTSLDAFAQPYAANTNRQPFGFQLPFRLNTGSGLGECTHDINHDWRTQQLSRDDGAMDAFVQAHTPINVDGPTNGLLTMGYHNRVDLPYHYALADAFTICDRYHCSIMGPTHPNRLMSISGSIDPQGTHGGPVLTTKIASEALFSAHWTTVPELLEDAGVSWKTYTTPGEGYYPPNPDAGFGDAILPYFSQYKNPRSSLYKKAFLPTYPYDFAHDVRSGTLPSVSWIISPNGYDEHPPSPPGFGAWYLDRVLRTLISNEEVWARTVVFITYDENGGFFDHVAPPVAPPGTAGEYITADPLPLAAKGVAGPLGLGFRVPMLVVSPFSRGGYVSSDVFDHTSQIRFLEERFALRAPGMSAWRRQTVGDLTSTLRPGRANVTAPLLPRTTALRTRALTVQGCTRADVNETSSGQPPYPMATIQIMPSQEEGAIKRLAQTST